MPFKMEEERMIENLERIATIGGCDIEDLEMIATADFTDYEDETVKRMEGVLFGCLRKYGKEIEDRNEDFPNNPYKFGYHLDDADFWTGYTGLADRYWGNCFAMVERECYSFGLETLENCEDVEEYIYIDEDGTKA